MEQYISLKLSQLYLNKVATVIQWKKEKPLEQTVQGKLDIHMQIN